MDIRLGPASSASSASAASGAALLSAVADAPDTLSATLAGARRVHLLLVAGHPPFRDPRIAWQVECAAPGDAFVCIGLHADATAPAPTMRLARPNAIEIAAWRCRPRGESAAAHQAWSRNLQAAGLVALLAGMEQRTAEDIATGHRIDAARVPAFRDICRHFTASARALVDLGTGLSRIDNVIAADVDSLLPALVLKSWFGVPLVYDAHEVWPESVPGFCPGEVDFWSDVEGLLARQADARFVASIPSAQYMSRRLGVPFEGLSNCEPRATNPPRPAADANAAARPAHFLYQGILARQRGLLPLVEAWPQLHSDAVLVIRGPDNDPEFVAALKAAAGPLLDKRIVFAPPVREEELVDAAAAADVGLIPYEPVNINNQGACPNKLSQYLAAGLPILTNDLPFVRQLVEEGRCGLAVDFADRAALVRAIDTLAGDAAERAAMAARARATFDESFHWELQGRPFYAALDRLVPAGPDNNAAAPCTLAWRATPCSPAEAFAELARVHGLSEVFPLQAIDSIGTGDANHLIDLRRRASVELYPDPDGPGASAGFQLPRVVDVTHVLIRFAPDSQPRGVVVEAHNEGGLCGSSAPADPEDGMVLAALSGNPTAWFTVRAASFAAGTQAPIITACRCLSFGIVRDQKQGAGPSPAPRPAQRAARPDSAGATRYAEGIDQALAPLAHTSGPGWGERVRTRLSRLFSQRKPS